MEEKKIYVQGFRKEGKYTCKVYTTKGYTAVDCKDCILIELTREDLDEITNFFNNGAK